MPARRPTSPPAAVKTRRLSKLTDEAFARSVGPAPDWLEEAWAHARKCGLDKLTDEEIQAEIDTHRQGKSAGSTAGTK